MAIMKKSLSGDKFVETIPKKTRQGLGNILSSLLLLGINQGRDIGVKGSEGC